MQEEHLIQLFFFSSAPNRLSWAEVQELRHLAFSIADTEGTISSDDISETNGVTYELLRINVLDGKKFTFYRSRSITVGAV